MMEAVQIYGSGSPVNLYSSSSTGNPRYWPLTLVGRTWGMGTNEAANRTWFDVAGTLSDWRQEVLVNTRADSCVMSVRKNGSNTSMAITVTAGATGWFEDLTNDVTVAAADYLTIGVPNTGLLKDFVPSRATWLFTLGSADDSPLFMHGCDAQLDSTNTRILSGETKYASMHGRGSNSPGLWVSTESQTHLYLLAAGTVKKFRAWVSTNTATFSVTLTGRKNGGDESPTITIAAGVTGHLSDLTSEVTCAANDYVTVKAVAGTGSGTCYIVNLFGLILLDDPDEWVTIQQYTGTTGTSIPNAVHYWDPGPQVSLSTNETYAKREVDYTTKLGAIGAYWYTTIASDAWTFTSRINGIDGSLSFTRPVGGSGLYVSTGDGDDLVATDEWDIKASAPGNTFQYINGLYALFGAVASGALARPQVFVCT